MKFKFKTLAAVALIVSAFSLQPSAFAQVENTTIKTATNLAATVATLVSSNQTSRIPVYQGRGLAIEVRFAATAGTSNVVYELWPSLDRTNLTSVALHSLVSTATGTTPVTNTFILRADQIAGVREFNIVITNGLSGTLTNRGVRWSYPN